MSVCYKNMFVYDKCGGMRARFSCTGKYGTEDRKGTVPVWECVLNRHRTGTIPIILVTVLELWLAT